MFEFIVLNTFQKGLRGGREGEDVSARERAREREREIVNSGYRGEVRDP